MYRKSDIVAFPFDFFIKYNPSYENMIPSDVLKSFKNNNSLAIVHDGIVSFARSWDDVPELKKRFCF